ncbi:hypothetical protein C0993_006929 [Termitomyces sp. T159_Od127]|nr:hypothetical protein C0993_006929 [Termitomyces sp. T159_Od127]
MWSHPSSPQMNHQLQHFGARPSLNNITSSHSRSHSQKPWSTEYEFPSDPSASLTPAAAVVAAYKQQENLHETKPIVRSSIEVDVGASMKEYSKLGLGKKMKKRPHTSSGHGRSAMESRPPTSAMGSNHMLSEEDGGKHRPYYTVFGTSSDHVVTAGGPEDRHHLSWEIVPPNGLARKASEGGDGGGLRTLTRKMSGRFKRAGNGTQSEGEEERRRVSLHTERERGRQSFQERSRTRAVLGKGEKSGLSLRLSIDKYAEAKMIMPVEEKDTTPTSATKSRGSGTSTPSPSVGGSKIWKLMKRLSTGALREKFVNHDEAPPVPSLPKEYAVPDQIRSFDAKAEAISGFPFTEGFSKAVRKKASVILGVKATSNCGSPIKAPVLSSPLASQVPTPIIRPSPLVPRPSTTTRSSSPVSSDVASSRFFANHKPSSMSAHSSTSSLPFEDNTYPPPPLPPSLFYKDSNVCQHIVPPSELGKVHVQPDEYDPRGDEVSPASSSPSNLTIQSPHSQMKLRLVVPTRPLSPLDTHCERDDCTITHTPLAPEMASLSLPPRRPGMPLGRMRRDTYASLTGDVGQDQDDEHEADEVVDEDIKEWEWLWGINSNQNLGVDEKILDSHSGSPLIPSFSIDNPINTFSSRRTSTASRQNSKTSASASLPHTIQPHSSEIPSPAESLPLPPRPARSPQRPASNPTQSNQTPFEAH